MTSYCLEAAIIKLALNGKKMDTMRGLIGRMPDGQGLGGLSLHRRKGILRRWRRSIAAPRKEPCAPEDPGHPPPGPPPPAQPSFGVGFPQRPPLSPNSPTPPSSPPPTCPGSGPTFVAAYESGQRLRHGDAICDAAFMSTTRSLDVATNANYGGGRG